MLVLIFICILAYFIFYRRILLVMRFVYYLLVCEPSDHVSTTVVFLCGTVRYAS